MKPILERDETGRAAKEEAIAKVRKIYEQGRRNRYGNLAAPAAEENAETVAVENASASEAAAVAVAAAD